MLATLFLSQGTPMLLAGDEFSNSQKGNNNAYCQDNDIGWVNWDHADTDLQAFVCSLSAFRRDHLAVRQDRFLHGVDRPSDGFRDVYWSDFKGEPLEWRDPGLANLCLTLRCSAEAPAYEPDGDVVFVAFNRSIEPGHVILPSAPDGQYWIRAIDTDQNEQGVFCELEEANAIISGHSVVAFVLKSDEDIA